FERITHWQTPRYIIFNPETRHRQKKPAELEENNARIVLGNRLQEVGHLRRSDRKRKKISAGEKKGQTQYDLVVEGNVQSSGKNAKTDTVSVVDEAIGALISHKETGVAFGTPNLTREHIARSILEESLEGNWSDALSSHENAS